MPIDDEMKALRSRSGDIKINSKLVSFLYELMRDHLSPGKVEELTRASQEPGVTYYSNGWLAQYAEDIANRLKDQ
jgi:hypothetical protein